MAELTKKSWSEIEPEKLSDSITRKFIHGDKVMIAELNLKKGAVVPEHKHENEQVSWILQGEMVFEIQGKEITVKAGDVLVIPSNVPHKVTAKEDSLDIDLFSPIREDWIKGEDSYLRG